MSRTIFQPKCVTESNWKGETALDNKKSKHERFLISLRPGSNIALCTKQRATANV